jgi:hypothetical protein
MDTGKKREEVEGRVEELLQDFEGGVLRLRGMPFSVTHTDVQKFFEAYKLRSPGVFLLSGQDGRVTGDAFVVFDSEEQATEAMVKVGQALSRFPLSQSLSLPS